MSVSLSTGTAGAASLSVVGGPSAIGAMTIFKWLAVGALSGTVVAGGSAIVQYESKPENSDARTMRTLRESRTPSGPPSLAAEPSSPTPAPVREASPSFDVAGGRTQPGTPSEVVDRSPSLGSTSARQAAVVPPADGASVRTSQLSLELTLIDRARASLAIGAAEQALRELSTYNEIRATGTLDREAWILRIDALLVLGKLREAGDLAQSYLERFPRDAHAARLLELANGR
jgi:hypothetical protein